MKAYVPYKEFPYKCPRCNRHFATDQEASRCSSQHDAR